MHASVMINWGASGNVIGYNFSDGNFKENALNCMMTDMTYHGAHPMFNLWEGNVAISFTPDSYWGSASHNTAFRNWLRGTTEACMPFTGRAPEDTSNCHWEVQNTRAIALDYANRYFNLVGNVAGSPEMLQLTYYNNGTQPIPTTPVTIAPQLRSYDNMVYGYAFGYASSGDDGTSPLANTLPYATLFWHGDVNLVNNATVWDAGTGNHTLPASLYLTSKPSWFGGSPWPGIGPDVPGYYGKNPAQLCYEQGKMPGCQLSTGVPAATWPEISVTLFPNPGNGIFSISSSEEIAEIEILNMIGEKIYTQHLSASQTTIDLSEKPAGIYMIQLKNNSGKIITKKISILENK